MDQSDYPNFCNIKIERNFHFHHTKMLIILQLSNYLMIWEAIQNLSITKKHRPGMLNLFP